MLPRPTGALLKFLRATNEKNDNGVFARV